jgi:hypothetical protein
VIDIDQIIKATCFMARDTNREVRLIQRYCIDCATLQPSLIDDTADYDHDDDYLTAVCIVCRKTAHFRRSMRSMPEREFIDGTGSIEIELNPALWTSGGSGPPSV